MKKDSLESLDGRDFTAIDERMEEIVSKINNATKISCPIRRSVQIKGYEFTASIKLKLLALQDAYSTYFTLNFPSLQVINNIKRELLLDITIHQRKSWRHLVELAVDNYGDPNKFWKDLNRLRGKQDITTTSLVVPPGIPGKVQGTVIEDSEDKAELMGSCWETIFHPNSEPQFINANTKKVNTWYRGIKPSLQHKNTIDFTTLDNNHPIFRQITPQKLILVIKSTQNNTPGTDNIKIKQLINLPPNYIRALTDLHNSSLSTQYSPFPFCTKPNCAKSL